MPVAEIQCKYCKTTTKKYLDPKRIKHGMCIFCSRDCANKYNGIHNKVWNKGKTGIYSEETLKKMSTSKIGKRTGAMVSTWKGDDVGYNALHAWVAKNLGKPNLCSSCNFSSSNSRQFHWSNISGKYMRDLSDWRRLCVKCHVRVDDIHSRGWKTRKAII